MSQLDDLMARIALLESSVATIRREHREEIAELRKAMALQYSKLSAEIHAIREHTRKAIHDLHEMMGNAARDLGGSAKALNEQGARLEAASKTIRIQGWFLARLGLLVLVGAAMGGGAFQSCLWWSARHSTTEQTSK